MFFTSRMRRDMQDFQATYGGGPCTKQRSSTDQPSAATSTQPGEGGASLDKASPVVPEKSPNEADQHSETMASTCANWTGKLVTDGSIWLEGELSGEIEVGETVFIASGARARANIQARRAIIGGDVDGHILCRELLLVERGGRLQGKVTTKTLILEDGAVVESEIRILRDENTGEESATSVIPARGSRDERPRGPRPSSTTSTRRNRQPGTRARRAIWGSSAGGKRTLACDSGDQTAAPY